MESASIYEKKVFDLKQLLGISRALNSTLDYHYLTEAVLDMCLAQAQTITAGLFLAPDMESEVLLPVHSSKRVEFPDEFNSFQIKFDAPFIRYFANEKPYLTMQEIAQLFPTDLSTTILRRMGAELIVGMFTRGKVTGIIFLGEKMTGEQYTTEECDFLADLASLSGIAVLNARLYEMATVDQMTGLKNHAFFQKVLSEEREKAKERETSLAILFADIDNFKKFNDSYGHQAGDFVLKEIGKILTKCIRKSDMAARYGGEEFCIIMPGSNEKAAMHVGERIRADTKAAKIKYEKQMLSVTISVGVALFDPKLDAKKNTNLIQRADNALYSCKKSGRNKVLLYTERLK